MCQDCEGGKSVRSVEWAALLHGKSHLKYIYKYKKTTQVYS